VLKAEKSYKSYQATVSIAFELDYAQHVDVIESSIKEDEVGHLPSCLGKKMLHSIRDYIRYRLAFSVSRGLADAGSFRAPIDQKFCFGEI
jgi:hypothetical protein